jgi:hypothetical protein
MPRKVSCNVIKKINSQIRRKLRGALADLKKNQPRSAATKLYQASNLIGETTKGIWDKSSAAALKNEAHSVSFKLCSTSMMFWPKWQDRTKAMLATLDKIDQKTTSRCQK